MSINKLNRFTNLPILIDLLERQKLVLVRPSTWDDKNDTSLLELYKERKELSDLFVLCFSYESETIHHWKSFADGVSGCCIEFDGKKIINVFETVNLNHGKIKYKTIRGVNPKNVCVKDLPFRKRYPYRIESEYRAIWEGEPNSENTFEINISMDIIRLITFGPNMPESIFKTLKELLEDKYPILQGKINRSTILENQNWIDQHQLISS